jgi:hypothetical protein
MSKTPTTTKANAAVASPREMVEDYEQAGATRPFRVFIKHRYGLDVTDQDAENIWIDGCES